MSFNNLFRCCNKYDNLTQISGVLLGGMIGYSLLGPNVRLPKKIEIDKLDFRKEKPINIYEQNIKEQIKINEMIRSDLLFGSMEYGIYDIPINNLFSLIAEATVNYIGPIFTSIQFMSGTVILGTFTYYIILAIRRLTNFGNMINPTIVSIDEIMELQRNSQISYDSVSNNIVKELEIKKFSNDIVNNLNKEAQINKQLLKEVLGVLNDMAQAVKKVGGNTEFIEKNIDKVMSMGEELLILKSKTNTKILNENEISLTTEGSNVITAVNLQEATIRRENDNLLQRISQISRITYNVDLEKVRQIWREKNKQTESETEKLKTEQEEEQEEETGIRIITQEINFEGTLEEFRERLRNFGRNIREQTIEHLKLMIVKFESLLKESGNNSNVIKALIEDLKKKLEYYETKIKGIEELSATYGINKAGGFVKDEKGNLVPVKYKTIGNKLGGTIKEKYLKLFAWYQNRITYFNTRVALFRLLKEKLAEEEKKDKEKQQNEKEEKN